MNGITRCPVCSGFRYIWGPQYAVPCANCKGSGVVPTAPAPLLNTPQRPPILNPGRFSNPLINLPNTPSFPSPQNQLQRMPPVNFQNDMTLKFPRFNAPLGVKIKPTNEIKSIMKVESHNPRDEKKVTGGDSWRQFDDDRVKRSRSPGSSFTDDSVQFQKRRSCLSTPAVEKEMEKPISYPSAKNLYHERAQIEARDQRKSETENQNLRISSFDQRVSFRPASQSSASSAYSGMIKTHGSATQTSTSSYEDLDSRPKIVQYPHRTSNPTEIRFKIQPAVAKQNFKSENSPCPPSSINIFQRLDLAAPSNETKMASRSNSSENFSNPPSSINMFQRLGPPIASNETKMASPEKFDSKFPASGQRKTQTEKIVGSLLERVDGTTNDFRKRGLGPNELYLWDIREGETRRTSIQRRFPHYRSKQVSNRLRFERRYDTFVMNHPVDPNAEVDRHLQLREYTENQRRLARQPKESEESEEICEKELSHPDLNLQIFNQNQFSKPKYRNLLLNLVKSSNRTPFLYGKDRGSIGNYIPLSEKEEIQFYTLIVMCMEENILPQETTSVDLFRPLIQSWTTQFGTYLTAARSAIEKHLSSSSTDFQTREERFHSRLRDLLTIHPGPPHRYRVWIANWSLWSNMVNRSQSKLWGTRIPPFAEMVEAYNEGRSEGNCRYENTMGFEDLDVELSTAYPSHPEIRYEFLEELVEKLEDNESENEVLVDSKVSNGSSYSEYSFIKTH